MTVNAKRAICYVDGLNSYHSIRALKKPQLKWLDLWALSRSLLSAEDELHAVVYFTAIADWLPDKARRHRRYVVALRERGVEVAMALCPADCLSEVR